MEFSFTRPGERVGNGEFFLFFVVFLLSLRLTVWRSNTGQERSSPDRPVRGSAARVALPCAVIAPWWVPGAEHVPSSCRHSPGQQHSQRSTNTPLKMWPDHIDSNMNLFISKCPVTPNYYLNIRDVETHVWKFCSPAVRVESSVCRSLRKARRHLGCCGPTRCLSWRAGGDQHHQVSRVCSPV